MTDDNLSFLFFSSFFESGCYRGFIKDFQEQILSKLLPDSHLLPWRIFTDADIHQEAKKPRKTGLNEKWKKAQQMKDNCSCLCEEKFNFYFHSFAEPGKLYDRLLLRNEKSVGKVWLKLLPSVQHLPVFVHILRDTHSKSQKAQNNRYWGTGKIMEGKWEKEKREREKKREKKEMSLCFGNLLCRYTLLTNLLEPVREDVDGLLTGFVVTGNPPPPRTKDWWVFPKWQQNQLGNSVKPSQPFPITTGHHTKGLMDSLLQPKLPQGSLSTFCGTHHLKVHGSLTSLHP